jgi:hypothetical protein
MSHPEHYYQHRQSFLDGKIYPPIGKCIYCGSVDNLTKEHILPFALSGTAVLLKSSCRACATITGKVEQLLLRGSFWPVRVFRDLKSRTKHKDAPGSFPVTAFRDGKEEVMQLPVDELPILLHFPLFPPPSFLSQLEPSSGILTTGFATVLFGKAPSLAAKELGATGLRFLDQQRPKDFARMIAKVAYAFACAEGAISDIEGASLVLPAILGKQNDIGAWLGTLTKPFESHPGVLHRIELHYDTRQGLLFAEVQLFADSDTPSYGVVLGKLRQKVV